MNKNFRNRVLIFSSFALIGLVTFLSGFEFLSAQGAVPKPSNSWTFDAKGVSSQRISDKAGRFSGKTIGVPSFKQLDAHSFYEFHGTDGFLLKENATGAESGMPHEKFSLASWIRIDEGTTNGGIIGCIQDNGNFEKGWLVGYDNEKFNFILSSQGADDGDGKITTLRSKSNYQKGKWFHLAASYDGASMRIFINGKLEGESKEQSKAINYASAAPFIIGRYRDDDEDFGLVGAIKEINLYQSALSTDQITTLFEKDAALANLAPIPLPTGFVIAPYLQFPTKSSITIMWETSALASSTVKFGTKLPLEMFATKEGTSLIHEVLLEKLEPATKYFYQVESKSDAGGIALSGVLTFQTAVVDDDPFSFCVIGDTQKNPKMTGTNGLTNSSNPPSIFFAESPSSPPLAIMKKIMSITTTTSLYPNQNISTATAMEMQISSCLIVTNRSCHLPSNTPGLKRNSHLPKLLGKSSTIIILPTLPMTTTMAIPGSVALI
ncbi:hypothetical protein EBS67_12020 [bacterium]|nr:hypothetical protein [bacterium]